MSTLPDEWPKMFVYSGLSYLKMIVLGGQNNSDEALTHIYPQIGTMDSVWEALTLYLVRQKEYWQVFGVLSLLLINIYLLN